MRRRRGGWAVLLLAAATASAAAAPRSLPVLPLDTRGVAPRGYPCQVVVQPGNARIGQRVLYRGRVVLQPGSTLRWHLPAGGGAFEWSSPRTRRIPAFPGSVSQGPLTDTMQIELTLQAFAPGLLMVPELGFEMRERTGQRWVGRLPAVRLVVDPVVSPGDTSAALRPLRGPLEAPWWERVPWLIVALAVLALGAVAFVVWRLRRRRSAAPAPARARPAKDPAIVLLEEIEALRGLGLPGHGRFPEHAFRLTRILRKFLEATQGAPRPGDSTPELVDHLGAAQMAATERERIAALLAAWDRVKFARAVSSPEEARLAEDAVGDLARRRLLAARGGAA